uniref:Uncharacterized protein n=1 Tax=Caldimicrobium thiodismutans TaxID=1653476 RepID=A0A832GP90_9BACT
MSIVDLTQAKDEELLAKLERYGLVYGLFVVTEAHLECRFRECDRCFGKDCHSCLTSGGEGGKGEG